MVVNIILMLIIAKKEQQQPAFVIKVRDKEGVIGDSSSMCSVADCIDANVKR